MRRFLMWAASILLAAIIPFAAAGLLIGSVVGLHLLNPVLGNVFYAALAISGFAFFVSVTSRSLFGLFDMSTTHIDTKTEVSDDENRD